MSFPNLVDYSLNIVHRPLKSSMVLLDDNEGKGLSGFSYVIVHILCDCANYVDIVLKMFPYFWHRHN